MCETKKCAHCGRELPVAMFGVSNKASDGLQSWCKACLSEYNAIHGKMRREEKKALKEKLFAEAQKAAEAQPSADVIVTDSGRVLKRVIMNNKPLEDYSPRELLAELKRRGYVWDNLWIKQRVEYSKI